MDFSSPGHGKIKQNHCTAIKKQGFAEFLENPSGDRFLVDFEVNLEHFLEHFGHRG